HLDQLGVGPVGEQRVTLEQRPELEAALAGDGLPEDDAMRIADRNEHSYDRPERRIDGRPARLAERGSADVDLAHDFSPISRQHANSVRAAAGPQLERIGRVVLEDRVTSRDSEPVATLLSLRPIGVEDAN